MEKPLLILLFCLGVCLLVTLGASVGVCVQALKITGKPREYISLAKVVADIPALKAYEDTKLGGYLATYPEVIIETLESSEMRRRALDRMRALHPDFKEIEITIKVSKNKDSAVFNIRAIGTEPKYTRNFLDALLDEFIAFRGRIDAQQHTAPAIKIMERASSAVEDLQDWAFPIATGLIAGGLAGLLLSLMIAGFIRGAIRSARPPSLPTPE